MDVCENESPSTLLQLLGPRAALHVSQDHPDLLKMYIYTHTHTKLTYFEHPNKNIDNPDLRITRRFNKNKNNVTLTTFLQ